MPNSIFQGAYTMEEQRHIIAAIDALSKHHEGPNVVGHFTTEAGVAVECTGGSVACYIIRIYNQRTPTGIINMSANITPTAEVSNE